MLVAFPISGTFGTAFCDLAFWWTGDGFWPRAGLWAAGAAFSIGVLAALAGLAETLLVPGVRRRAAAWSHASVAMVLLAVLGASFALRLEDATAAVLPWGSFLSGLSLVLVALTGWHGGKLVFAHQVGIQVPKEPL